VPKNAELWTESVRVERRANNIPQAKVLMAKALQEVPDSGLLWSESIWYLEPRTQRKPRSLEAIRKVDNDPILFVAVARIFWGERRLEKAQGWFEKAVLLDSDLGDTWAWYYRFLLQHGTEVSQSDTGNCSVGGWEVSRLTIACRKREKMSFPSVNSASRNMERYGRVWPRIPRMRARGQRRF
jgi:tetratricopeptide (TPR) repeat protein